MTVRCTWFAAFSVSLAGCSLATTADDDGGNTEDLLTGNRGCMSATLGKMVPALTCVQAKADRVWYQCVDSHWLPGVHGSQGPNGACATTHPLGGGDPGTDAGAVGTGACTSAAHIGDSLSAYTKPGLQAEYTSHGVTDLQISAFGGRAILQKLHDDPETGKAAATRIAATGFDGCWIVALGTNDTANIAAGSNVSRADTIDRMMRAIDPDARARVMWVNTFTTKSSGYWSNANMKLWNEALEDAKGRWANLKVFDWATTAATGVAPYADGIHHTTAGYAVRNKAIADALVSYFPANGNAAPPPSDQDQDRDPNN